MAFGEEALKYLNLGIESEIAAYVFYKRAMKLVGDQALRDVLGKPKRIIGLVSRASGQSRCCSYQHHGRIRPWHSAKKR